MKVYLIPLLSIIAFIALGSVSVKAEDSIGITTQFTQPNGAKIKLRMVGDNNYSRTETMDGYTVIYSALDQTYYYAELNAAKDEFVATDRKADKKPLFTQKKHIQLQSEARIRKATEKDKKLHAERRKRWDKRVKGAKVRRARKKLQRNNIAPSAGDDANLADHEHHDLKAAPVLGNKVGLTIIVQFPDDTETEAVDPTNFPVTQNQIERFCNEVGYSDNGNSGSVRDYFFDQSNGAVTYTMSVTQIVTMPQPRNFYNYSDYPANTKLRDSGEAGNRLVSDSVAALKAANFDFNGLTLDGDNVRSTNIFFAGDTSGVWSEGLWPHAWGMYRLAKPEVTVDGVTRYINEYQITNLSSVETRIGTFCHESGHLIFDFPDLYDTNSGSSGLSRHCLMSSGNHSNGGRTPTPINIYLKSVVGWANITDITALTDANVNLPALGNIGYRIVNPNNNDESFYVENRGYANGVAGGDKWAQYGHDQGLMIWHVDEAVSHNRNEQMTAAEHYKVSLEQQDGEFDLEGNRGGDSTDLFDTNSAEFNDYNTPNANWWDGTASGIKMNAKSVAGTSMNVVFGVENYIKVLSPNGGENLLANQSYEIKWDGSIRSNVKIDLYRGGAFVATIAANEVNDGAYSWNLNNAYPLAPDYSIKITSVANGAIFDDSDAVFSIATERFAGGGIIPAGMVQSAGSTKGWIVTADQASEGVYSLTNDDIDDNQKAEIEHTVTTSAGTISFDAKVSSEADYDFLRFYIDGVQQDLDSTKTGVNGLAGDRNWESKSFQVTAGEHTFKWSYLKDNSVSEGTDQAWIDNVVFPAAPLTGIALWTSEQFSGDDPKVNANSADPDRDGISNMLEYALGLDPNKMNLNNGIVVEKDGNTISLIYTKNKKATDVDFGVQHSLDLIGNSWAMASVNEKILSTTGDVERIEATMVVPSGETNHFMRLKVDLKP